MTEQKFTKMPELKDTTKPKIYMDSNVGTHNMDLEASRDRLIQGNTYKDMSTICIVPTRGMISAKVVQNWMGLMTPMNQKFTRIFISGMEVGQAYNAAVESILDNPELSKWKYVFTLEEDNLPPPDCLLKLLKHMDKYDAVGSLYWTKGEEGQPMIYGDPNVFPKNFIPRLPVPGALLECNGLGMGATLFSMEMFKKMPKPWFKTVQQYTPGVGGSAYTQDLYFFEQAAKYGYRFACDCDCLTGHYDVVSDIVW
jgi:hypothetical protein